MLFRILSILNPVSVTAPAKVVTAEFAIAAAGNYAAEDVVSTNATTGYPWYWPGVARNQNGFATISKGLALCSTTGLVWRLRVYLFNGTPTSEMRDNVANTGIVAVDRYLSVGWIDFPAMSDVGGMSQAIVTPSTDGNLPLRVKTDANGGLSGIVVALDAETNEAAGMNLMISFIAEQD